MPVPVAARINPSTEGFARRSSDIGGPDFVIAALPAPRQGAALRMTDPKNYVASLIEGIVSH